ncbi:UNVERIFIED_CONTAM: hypothetical protein HDU68_001559 [Siphonaria sp. JEL0065]|nr:hypothetical protein HDU68_001559 [Siphonaria sp. JEL0065]
MEDSFGPRMFCYHITKPFNGKLFVAPRADGTGKKFTYTNVKEICDKHNVELGQIVKFEEAVRSATARSREHGPHHHHHGHHHHSDGGAREGGSAVPKGGGSNHYGGRDRDRDREDGSGPRVGGESDRGSSSRSGGGRGVRGGGYRGSGEFKRRGGGPGAVSGGVAGGPGSFGGNNTSASSSSVPVQQQQPTGSAS